MTPLRVSLVGVVASLLLILIVLELVRGRRLKERYALLWLATGIVLLVLSAWREALNTIAGWLGVTGYPPAVLFAVATLFILLVLLHYSTVLSRLTDENVELAQRIALLEERMSRRNKGEAGLALRSDVRSAEREDVTLRVVVEPVRPDPDAVPRSGRPVGIEVLGISCRRDRHRADEAVPGP